MGGQRLVLVISERTVKGKSTHRQSQGSQFGKIKITQSCVIIFIGTICTYLSVDERGGT